MLYLFTIAMTTTILFIVIVHVHFVPKLWRNINFNSIHFGCTPFRLSSVKYNIFSRSTDYLLFLYDLSSSQAFLQGGISMLDADCNTILNKEKNGDRWETSGDTGVTNVNELSEKALQQASDSCRIPSSGHPIARHCSLWLDDFLDLPVPWG